MAAPQYKKATVTFNPDGTISLGNKPAGAYATATEASGGDYDPVAVANFGGTGGLPTDIAEAISLSGAQALAATFDVASNVLYAIEDSTWNGGNGDNMAWVIGLDGSTFDVLGTGLVNGVLQVVTINVAAATYAPFAAGGPAGTARDPFAVGDVASITAAVTDASNTWADGDLTAYGSTALQNAGAPAAVANQHPSILVGTADVVTLDEFDYPDAGGVGGWRYRYGRRNNGTSGWTRIPKG